VGVKDLFSFFDADARKQKSFDKMVGKLVSKNQQHEERLAVIEELGRMATPEADAALFRRWDMMADKQREDVAEKEYLAEVLVSKGKKIVPHIERHNDRSPNVTWPLQVLSRVSGEEAVLEEILRVLGNEQRRLASFKPEKKVRLLQLLSDYDGEGVEAAAIVSLGDFDETVRWEATQQLGRVAGEVGCAALVDRLGHDDEDSIRVRRGIVDALFARQWKVLERRDEVTPHLSDDFRIGPKGTLIRVG
jgi:HEAT repeat protein